MAAKVTGPLWRRTHGHLKSPMENDFGLDLQEIMKVIDTAEVLVVRFAIVDRRLLIDARHNQDEGPLIKLVPRASSIEERFRHLKQLRPRFPLPERIMSFMWPRHVALLQASGVWQHIVDRLEALGHDDTTQECEAAYQELLAEERAQVVAAIRGESGYQSLWERRV
jgi:hypothetical protein